MVKCANPDISRVESAKANSTREISGLIKMCPLAGRIYRRVSSMEADVFDVSFVYFKHYIYSASETGIYNNGGV